MNDIEFTIESVENQEDVIRFLDDKIYEYNSSIIPGYEANLFAKVIRDENKNIIAAISGWIWAMASEVTLLWVKEGYRKSGLGKRLLIAAEREMLEKGCVTVLVKSYSFQAPLFYEKNGYTIVYVLDNFPHGHQCYHLVKRF